MTDKPAKITEDKQSFMYAGTEKTDKFKSKNETTDKLDKDSLDDLWAAINDLIATFTDYFTELTERFTSIEKRLEKIERITETISGGGDLVSQGPGITLGNGHVRQISVHTGLGLTYEGTGTSADPVAVSLAETTPGLEFDVTENLKVKANAAAGIELLSDGVSVDLATDPGLEFSTGLKVKAGDGIDVVAGGVAVDLKADSGLEVVSTELAVKLDTTADSIHMTSSGLHVNFKVCA
jgi:hypothetical protein